MMFTAEQVRELGFAAFKATLQTGSTVSYKEALDQHLRARQQADA